jgi:hypothetical protein
MRRLWQLFGYLWALPATCLGLVCAAIGLASGARMQWVEGVLEVHGGFVTWMLKHGMPWMEGGAAAMTLGHVVLGCDRESLDITRRHERVHVRQYQRWGPLFLPLYGYYSFVLWWQGRDAYRDNPFEVEAYDEGNDE